MKKILIILSGIFSILILLSSNAIAHGDEEQKYHKAPTKKAYIISPKNGDTVPATFKVVFGLKGMQVSPAGIEKYNSGHHHLAIDLKTLPDLSIPLGASVTHFGGGQTETEVTLEPGTHTLQLILGDFKHQPHSPAVLSKKITVTVK
jgi:hypothetical protein